MSITAKNGERARGLDRGGPMIIRYHGQRPSACADTSATEQRIAGIDPEFNRQLGERARGDCWNTPHHYVERLLYMWRSTGGIHLDPCSNAHSGVPAQRNVMLPENGLLTDWDCINVFCNPPWSAPAPWYEKATRQKGGSTVMLTHAATGSKWWQQLVWPYARALCFHSPRLSFLDESGKPIKGNPRDCISSFYGDRHAVHNFREVFSALGHVVML